MTDRVLFSKAANALIGDADAASSLRSIHGGEVGEGIDGFRQRAGGLWVGGRVTLTDRELAFAPNLVNRSIQTGSLDVRIRLTDIDTVSVTGGVLTKIVEIQSGSQAFKFRCIGAPAVAEQIRKAAASAHG